MATPTRSFVYCKATFEGFHRWKDAPDKVAFLRDYHRHIFHVAVQKEVGGQNREIEFIMLKWDVESFLKTRFAGYENRFEFSCEQIAQTLLERFGAFAVTVNEDDENGAFVVRQPEGPFGLKEALSAIGVKDFGGTPSGAKSSEPPKEERPDPKKVQTRCFVGKEAEGPRRGHMTLFVPGSTTPEDFKKAWGKVVGKGLGLSQVYYGAGNDRNLRTDTLYEIVKAGGHSLTVEFHSYKEFDKPTTVSLQTLQRDGVILVAFGGVIDVDPPALLGHPPAPNYLKMIDASREVIKWIDLSTFEVLETSLNDPYFSTDRYV